MVKLVLGDRAMRSPITWYGGKTQMAKSIVAQFPPHTTFVDVFGGSAAILLAKEPSPVEVYNDIHSGLVTFWRVLRDPEQFSRFERMCQATPYSREEMEYCRANWQTEPDQVTKAWMFFVAVKQGFVGHDQGTKAAWAYKVATSNGGRAGTVNNWLNTVDGLAAVSQRVRDVQVEHRDYRQIITTYDTPETLFYCDPPYVTDTREAGSRAAYTHEMDEWAHVALVERLLTCRGKVILSGYDNALYTPLHVAGWTCRHRVRASMASNPREVTTKTTRTECLWSNPAAQTAQEVAS